MLLLSPYCSLCPKSQKVKDLWREFVDWQDYISSRYQHFCSTHGALGANTAITESNNWVADYFCNHRNFHQETSNFIYGALKEAGFEACGYWEQGNWHALPNGFYQARMHQRKSSEEEDSQKEEDSEKEEEEEVLAPTKTNEIASPA